MHVMKKYILAIAVTACVSLPAVAADGQTSSSRLIVKFQGNNQAATTLSDASKSFQRAAQNADVARIFTPVRRLGTGAILFSAKDNIDAGQIQRLLQQLKGNPAVAYAEFERITSSGALPTTMIGKRKPVKSATPALAPHSRYPFPPTGTDPLFAAQWNLTQPTVGISVQGAWRKNVTGVNTTIAFLDTGYTLHPELNILPGWDMVSNADYARDGNARDPNPRNEGEWLAGNDCGMGLPPDFELPSIWLGTRLMGIATAKYKNNIGLAGVAPSARVLPVRTGGYCSDSNGGAALSDLVDGLTWAVGRFTNESTPINPNRADVILLTESGIGSCPAALQDAINVANARNAVVVVPASADGEDTAGTYPSNCNNVIVAGGTDRQGARYQGEASASGWGSQVDLSAPAGDGYPLLTDVGTRKPVGPGYDEEGFMYGGTTAFAAAHVAGAAALVKSICKKLRNCNIPPKAVENILKKSVTPFPQTPDHPIGTGILNATKAIYETERYLNDI